MMKLFMDVHVHSAITDQLRLRGVDVLTAQEDGSREFPDSLLLDRASELGRILFTQDADLLAEAASRHRRAVKFAGVIYAAQKRVPVGKCIDDLELIAKTEDPDTWTNRVEYLPLK